MWGFFFLSNSLFFIQSLKNWDFIGLVSLSEDSKSYEFLTLGWGHLGPQRCNSPCLEGLKSGRAGVFDLCPLVTGRGTGHLPSGNSLIFQMGTFAWGTTGIVLWVPDTMLWNYVKGQVYVMYNFNYIFKNVIENKIFSKMTRRIKRLTLINYYKHTSEIQFFSRVFYIHVWLVDYLWVTFLDMLVSSCTLVMVTNSCCGVFQGDIICLSRRPGTHSANVTLYPKS